MSVSQWSTTASDNNAAPPTGAPEGIAPSSVNNILRQVMASVRELAENLPWFDFGHVPTRVDDATFTVATNLTAIYYSGRRIRLVGTTTGYGVVQSSDYSAPSTSVIVSLDSGVVPSSLATISLSNNIGTPVPPSDPVFNITDAELDAGISSINVLYSYNDPRRLGVSGSGDDTTAMNRVITMTNAGQSFLFDAITVTCGPLNTITADDVSWRFINGAQIKVKVNSWLLSGDGSTHLSISGDRAHLEGLTIDGNQSGFSSAPIGRLLQITGDDPTLIYATLKNSPFQGFRRAGTGGRYYACHFDDNANLGQESLGVSNDRYSQCTWDRNGYGFQLTLATNGFAAFGFALRYRSHDVDFIGCTANQNGRDGMNINQGSYNIKHVGCTAWMNGDGGFTIAADNSGSGEPSEAESPRDIEYVDCVAYNNWGSGLVSYQPTYNVTVEGGRYFNNNRIAGMQTFASSYPNGIYFAAGSLGITIRAEAYDDRQLRLISGQSGSGSTRTVTATGWVSGLTNYPRVAFYDASNAFQGYGTISSDSSGSLVVSSTANNGVPLASITSGWKVTQRTQHNGCFFDNACQGFADVDGFGHLPGPQAYTGFKVISGYLNHDQNIRIPGELEGELLANPSWDSAITSWTYSTPGGGSSAAHTSTFRRSTQSLRLIGGSSEAVGDATLVTDALFAVAGAFVQFSCWVYASAAGDGAIALYWTTAGDTFHTIITHPGGGWQKLAVDIYVPANVSALTARVSSAVSKTCYFDTASLKTRTVACDNRDYTWPSRFLNV